MTGVKGATGREVRDGELAGGQSECQVHREAFPTLNSLPFTSVTYSFPHSPSFSFSALTTVWHVLFTICLDVSSHLSVSSMTVDTLTLCHLCIP